MSQTQLDTDSFSGTAGTALHTYDANWINSDYSGNYFDHIISTPNGKAQAGGGGIQSANHRTGKTWTNDQYTQVTFSTLATSSMWAGIRMSGSGSDPNSGYIVGINPGNGGGNVYRIAKAITRNTDMAVSSTTAVAGDVINFEIVGSVMTVRINGSILSDLALTDATYTTGNPGLMTGSDAVAQFSAWSAGSATANAGTKIGSLLLMFR